MSEQRTAKTVAIILCVLLVGCAKGPEQFAKDRERGLLRHQYFVECMKLLPAGPVQTHYNDWDDVVDSCSSAAWYQANQVIP